MAEPFRLPSPLYAIVDTAQTSGREAAAIAEDMIAGGAGVIQLRVKERPANEFFHVAQAVRTLTSNAGCLLIVNDRLDIALAVDADGVHVGQEDLPLTVVRPLLKNKIIGVSTHSPAQAQAAEADGADYIGFGPIFGTRTKATGYTARGLTMLRRVRNAVRLPIVAIGGITAENVAETWRNGANAAAMISYLTHGDTVKRVQEVLELDRKLRG